ncbi:DNA polymerase III subunit epsilon [Asticcacaulis benevestitus]|uniref:DNA polymerase III subunit epsilon n=1 Tax=Asticcacaulis benevestitus DSM 16100 = ATCC BAA-896 TaxID=1121022 RepID=V4PCI5_9CAUL|nr:DNA polymerase III subunit epsilon [Asticcacaulis benevestitus]ESQ91612.1 DNA polymerase III subunit epsilon [Asticcacaulis benevestitus DSM 16100 = ATCC BAA-896]
MALEIVLDTETTGIDHRKGHRLIEIGCIEIEDLLPTGRTFHRFIDPEREIEPDAIRIHGITNDMVRGKPKFAAIIDEMLEFIGDRKIIAHNASFDRGFINMELERQSRMPPPTEQWIDTLEMARLKFPGAANSLDALCRRFNISLAERDLHGALIDARLLASVYLELLGGKERGLDLEMVGARAAAAQSANHVSYGARPRPLASRITSAEAEAHEAFVKKYLKERTLWA